MLKRLAATLPHGAIQALRRWRCRISIRRGTFTTDEPEFGLLADWIKPGDWVVDVGANLGIYTRRMSELVGPSGRVVALEPVPATFELLASNTADLGNVMLIQAAAANRNEVVRMSIPSFHTGLRNYYQAHIDGEGELNVVALVLSTLPLPKIALVKVDAEGHDLEVLVGMDELPPPPVLIVESHSKDIAELLGRRGYRSQQLEGSPNTLWRRTQ